MAVKVISEIPGLNLQDLKLKGLESTNYQHPQISRLPGAGVIFIKWGL